MNSEQFRLIIHHHHQVYIEGNGRLWVSSTLGRWLNSISPYFNRLILLLYQSRQRLPQQDTLIEAENVQVLSLGHYGKKADRLERYLSLDNVCKQATSHADGLLIRGITPRQRAIWQRTRLSYKAFLLVGSLTQKGSANVQSLWQLYAHLLKPYRLRQLCYMAKEGGLMMANSLQAVEEQQRRWGIAARFVPTSSIRRDEFAPLQVRKLSSPWRLLYCGRLDMDKGIGDLIKALSILTSRGFEIILDIVGAKAEPGYSYIVNLVRQFGLTSRVRFHGFIPFGPDLFHYYRRADALILPSYSEGFPHVIWEAAANSCPVIASRVGGIPALIKHERHGILVQAGAVDEIVSAVVGLFDNEALRQSVIEQAYGQAKNFTLEACARKLVDTLIEGWNIKGAYSFL